MSMLPMYLYGSEILRAEARSVEELDNSTIKLILDMSETMRKANGIGLAATQVGELKRVIVVDISGVADESSEVSEADDKDSRSEEVKALVLVNPEIIEEEGSAVMEEGCLSIPDVRADVQRAERIRVRFRDGDFRQAEITAEGLLGRVILHEVDHLDGVLFIDHINGAKRAMLSGKLRAIKRGEVETSYPVIAAVEV